MAPIRNGRVLFNAIPRGYPIPGETTVYDTTQVIDIDTAPLLGGFLLKTLVLSVDPYMRGRMYAPGLGDSYTEPFQIGKPLTGFGIGVVVRSETSVVEEESYIYGSTIPHQEYSIIPTLGDLEIIEKHPDLPWSTYLGAAGMPGQTAYMGWKEFAHGKQGETAFITSGAGSVGSMVIQLAKQAGMKVIASAGSEDKVKFMKEIGADIAFNYKTTNTHNMLKHEGPIDVYWDNVGGEMLEMVLKFAAPKGRLLECGLISGTTPPNEVMPYFERLWVSGYNSPSLGIRNLHHLVTKGLTMNGIFLPRLLPKYETEFYNTIPEMLAKGEIKYSADITKGLEKLGDVILAVQKGWNTGKAVVVVAEE
ncbi:hypothetical protein GGX14DRAFT_572062 [Mycena pura]|uniref:Enoyl reductase (ER) domain-containing protein n=1 Tax=Mycena pura TaxID=153505 RepID=A0AAD6V5B4_9AGAR|nr:hypothetical protein GGX14DRAFT_572062 [Mycena pura]